MAPTQIDANGLSVTIDPGASPGDAFAKASKEPKEPLKCPKCGAFAERVLISNDQRLSGCYCNKAGCGWTTPLNIPIPRLREVTDVLNASLFELLRTAPLNETARAHVLAAMDQPIPKSCVTFEQICDWITTVPDRAGKAFFKPGQPVPKLEMEVHYTYTESGSCNYSCRNSGTGAYELDREAIAALALECGSWDELVRAVKHRLYSDCHEDPPETEAHDYNYDDHEPSDTENHSCELNDDRLTSRLATFLDECLHEEYERLL